MFPLEFHITWAKSPASELGANYWAACRLGALTALWQSLSIAHVWTVTNAWQATCETYHTLKSHLKSLGLLIYM